MRDPSLSIYCFNATALAAITGGLSVGIGFGLKEVIANFISGIWLLLEGALKPGDIITIEGKISEVKELGLRAASVQVIRDNSEKIIPNHLLFSEEFTTNRGSDLLVARHLSVKTGSPCKIVEVRKINVFRAFKALQVASWYNEFTQKSVDQIRKIRADGELASINLAEKQ